MLVLLSGPSARPSAGETVGPRDQIQVGRDGMLRSRTGELYVPLGGLHGNVLPVSRINLSEEEMERVKPYIWAAQKTDGQGHVDLWDASDAVMDRWFKQLAADGVTALRLFPRARVGNDVLDLCGKLNPKLQQVFHRAFTIARPHGIRFLLQILPEPGRSSYVGGSAIEKRVLPRYTREELAALTPAQKRFIQEKKRVSTREYFTDPDVLACQKLYLEQALDWVVAEPQIFALEIYNEQAWTGRQFMYPVEDAEIRWSAEIVRTIKKRLPRMPVTLSHPGFGITGYDPFKWTRGAGVDFYSPHAYAGISGENEKIDFAAVAAASSRIMNSVIPSFYGEWGVFSSPVPMDIKRFSHRDGIWLCLLGGEAGFLQWTNEFIEEYRWPAKVMQALPRNFSPERPKLTVKIAGEYERFHTNSRYPAFKPGEFVGFELNRQKQQDENIQRIFAAYQRSLDLGLPIAFSMTAKGMTLDEFALFDPATVQRPIQAVGGYQLAWLKDARNPLWIAYLRNRRVHGFGRHFVGVPEEAPLEIRLSLPGGRYRARLINLNEGRMENRMVKAVDSIKVSERSSDDFVLVVTPELMRLALD
jgi:hypothetical protein